MPIVRDPRNPTQYMLRCVNEHPEADTMGIADGFHALVTAFPTRRTPHGGVLPARIDANGGLAVKGVLLPDLRLRGNVQRIGRRSSGVAQCLKRMPLATLR